MMMIVRNYSQGPAHVSTLQCTGCSHTNMSSMRVLPSRPKNRDQSTEYIKLFPITRSKLWRDASPATAHKESSRVRGKDRTSTAEPISGISVPSSAWWKSHQPLTPRMLNRAGQNNYIVNSQNVQLCCVIGVMISAEIYVCGVCVVLCVESCVVSCVSFTFGTCATLPEGRRGPGISETDYSPSRFSGRTLRQDTHHR